MSQKKVISKTVNSVVVASLFLMVGCGKQKAEPTEKTQQPIAIVKPAEVKTAIIAAPSNIAVNPSFEKAKIFDSGLYKKGKTPIEKPAGWTTKGQVLNDFTGWATNEAHTGKHSLKIKNIGGTDAYWEGKPIIFKKNINAFKISIWTKTKGIANKSGKVRFQLALDVYLKGYNNTLIKKYVAVDIQQTNHNWEKVQKTFIRGENIVKIIPYLYFSKMTGTVWFDDITISPLKTNIKTLYDSNINGFSNLEAVSKDGGEFFKVSGKKIYIIKDFIKVDKDSTYNLSGLFQSVGKDLSYNYFGLAFFTKDKRRITNISVNAIKNTETEVVKECGNKLLYLKDAENWIISDRAVIAYNVDTSGQLKDLPNFGLTACGVNKIEIERDYWKIHLTRSIGKVSKGMKIREHIKKGEYILVRGTVPRKLTKHQLTLSPENTLYKMAEYVKIILFANNKDTQELMFKNISFKEITVDNK